uniref:Ankyrin repeat domain-containing protein 7-like n=1 Tax=Diabrotica virgifera virgifera TaxID=50390 RepID=A0A6P7H2Z4_DIAVI
MKAMIEFNITTQLIELIKEFLEVERNLETLEKLISLSAYANILNHKRETPLHVACLNGHHSMVTRLLKYGAKLNVLDIERETPLFKSVRGGNKALTKYLITQKAVVNTSNRAKEKLIHLATAYNDMNLVEVLIDIGQDPNILTGSGTNRTSTGGQSIYQPSIEHCPRECY